MIFLKNAKCCRSNRRKWITILTVHDILCVLLTCAHRLSKVIKKRLQTHHWRNPLENKQLGLTVLRRKRRQATGKFSLFDDVPIWCSSMMFTSLMFVFPVRRCRDTRDWPDGRLSLDIYLPRWTNRFVPRARLSTSIYSCCIRLFPCHGYL